MKSQSGLKVKAGKLPKARENAGDQVVIGLDCVSDWLRGWCEFLGPITEQSEARPMHSRITFETYLKISQFLCEGFMLILAN